MERKVVHEAKWGVQAFLFKYMVNEGPSTSVVFTLLVGKQIGTGCVQGGCNTALWQEAELKFQAAAAPSAALSPQGVESKYTVLALG